MAEALREYSIAFMGRGGQGIVFAATSLARAAFIRGAYVAQLQSYGAEVRGGSVLAYVVLSSKPIENPFPEEFNIAVALHEAGVKGRTEVIRRSSLIIYDEELVRSVRGLPQSIGLPIVKSAIRRVGKPVANAVALGVIAGIIPPLKNSIREVLSTGKEGEMNLRAEEVGEELAKELSLKGVGHEVIEEFIRMLNSLKPRESVSYSHLK